MIRYHRLLSLLRSLVLLVVTLIGCSSHLGGEPLGSSRQALACIAAATADAAAPWKEQTLYRTGEFVEFQGQTYQCIQGHVSQSDWIPTVTPALWQIPPICGGTSQWIPQTWYDAGAVVQFQGQTYRVIQGHTAQADWSPDKTPALFEFIPFQAPNCPAVDDPTAPNLQPVLLVKAPEIGRTPGTFAVSDAGSATYAIPIVATPGRAGIEPAVALAYDSDAGNGLIGMGFSISGLSTIHRCSKDPVDAGVRSKVGNSSLDSLCLDGALLVLVSGTYGADGSEYRTVPDTFSRIQLFVNAASPTLGATFFKVWTKDGRIMEYGGRAGNGDEPSARILAANGVIRIWALSRVSDHSGNYMTIRYNQTQAPSASACQSACDEGATCVRGRCSTLFTGGFSCEDFGGVLVTLPAGTYCVPADSGKLPPADPNYTLEWSPDEIQYTGHEPSNTPPQRALKFLYPSGVSRPDVITAYELGIPLKTTQRLSGVRVFGPGRVAVREYSLSYEDAASHVSGRSRLHSLTECAFPDDTSLKACRPPTVFTWKASAVANENQIQFHRLQSGFNVFGGLFANFIIADFNGDGRDDIYSPTGFVAYSFALSDFTTGNLSATGYLDGLGANAPPLVTLGGNAQRFIPIDWNNDNRADLFVNDNIDFSGQATFKVEVTDTNSSGDIIFNEVDTKVLRTGKARLADVNGDGVLDLIRCDNAINASGFSKSTYLAFLYDGKTQTFTQPPELIASLFDDGTQPGQRHCDLDQFAAMDIRGTGASDLILGTKIATHFGGAFPWVLLDTKSLKGFTVFNQNQGLRALDINGDGLQDLLLLAPDGHLVFMVNNGADGLNTVPFQAPVDAVPGNPTFTPANVQQAMVMDYDYDGRADLLIPRSPDSGPSERFILHSLSDHFEVLPDSTLAGISFEQLYRIDPTGEGNSAFLGVPQPNDTGARPALIYRNGVDSPDLLRTVDDGMQGQTPDQLGYSPSVKIEYQALVNYGVGSLFIGYTPSNAPGSCPWPCKIAAGSKRIVKSYVLNSGSDVSGHRMNYVDGRYDRLRGEWLGFGVIQDFDADQDGNAPKRPDGQIRTDLAVSTRAFDNKTYDPSLQRFPFAGRPSFVVRTIGNVEDAPGTGLLPCESAAARFDYTAIFQTQTNGAKTYSIFNSRASKFHVTDGNCVFHASLIDGVLNGTTDSRVATKYSPDNFGNIASTSTFGDSLSTPITVGAFTYQNDQAAWLISQPLSAKVCDSSGSDPTKSDCRFAKFEYSPTGLLQTSIIAPTDAQLQAPDDPAHRLTMTYGYDAFGNMISSTLAGRDHDRDVTRGGCTSYDSEHLFPFATQVAGLPPMFERYDRFVGGSTTRLDANKLVSMSTYDSFGELAVQQQPDGSAVTIARTAPSIIVPADATHAFDRNERRIHLRSTTTNGLDSEFEYDFWGRPVRNWRHVVGKPERVVESVHYDPLRLDVDVHLFPAPESQIATAVSEAFVHDGLHRLRSSQLGGALTPTRTWAVIPRSWTRTSTERQ